MIIPYQFTVRQRKIAFKSQKTRLDFKFLQTWKTYNIISKFLNFKMYNCRVTRAFTYKLFQFHLLNYEINEKKKLLKLQDDDYETDKLVLHRSLLLLQHHCLFNRVT